MKDVLPAYPEIREILPISFNALSNMSSFSNFKYDLCACKPSQGKAMNSDIFSQ